MQAISCVSIAVITFDIVWKSYSFIRSFIHSNIFISYTASEIACVCVCVSIIVLSLYHFEHLAITTSSLFFYPTLVCLFVWHRHVRNYLSSIWSIVSSGTRANRRTHELPTLLLIKSNLIWLFLFLYFSLFLSLHSTLPGKIKTIRQKFASCTAIKISSNKTCARREQIKFY